MAAINWRTINIDALDPDSPANFDLSSLTPAVAPVSTADVQSTAQQIRQLLRGGDSEGALQGALESPPYGADDKGKVRCACACCLSHLLSMSLRNRPGRGHSHDRTSGVEAPGHQDQLCTSHRPQRKGDEAD